MLFGASVPFAIVFGLATRGLGQVWFDTVVYHLSYRSAAWTRSDLNHWDLRILSSWSESPQGLILVILALCGLLSLADPRLWNTRQKSQFTLCAFLIAGLGLFCSVTRPTFPQYFVLLMPFLSILAAVGVFALANRVNIARDAFWLTSSVSCLFILGSLPMISRRPWLGYSWQAVERVSSSIAAVTARNQTLFVDDDRIYFATKRLPPLGLENVYSAGLAVPPRLANLLNFVPQSRIDDLLKSSYFHTVCLLADDPRLESLNLRTNYTQSAKTNGRVILVSRDQMLH